MAIVVTEGEFPRRIGDYILYRRFDKVVLRAVSGFTTDALKDAERYELSRQNASEFGRVSALCKQVRVALYGILPKRNNLAVVNAFTKKMREVMTYDTTAARGDRQLATALATVEGKALLNGYAFNPDAKTGMVYHLTPTALMLKMKNFKFTETADYVGFRLHHLAFDFNNTVHELVSTDWWFERPVSWGQRIVLPKPTTPDLPGTVLTLLEVQFYHYTAGTYVPMVDDSSKSVVVVACE